MGKRRRFSRWRRLPGVYRFGDDKPTDPHDEPQRLTVYLPGHVLDRAEMQAVRLGYTDSQEYCTEVLFKAIEAEHFREHVADVESKRGALEGLNEIAEDVEYLTELSAASARGHDEPTAGPGPDDGAPSPVLSLGPERAEITFLEGRDRVGPPDAASPSPSAPTPAPAPLAKSQSSVPAGGAAAEVVLRHAAQAGDDPYAFLPCLRRGEPVPAAEVGELAQALSELESRYRGTTVMDRALTFALHRLAFESQILQTDAWPGAFDVWTVDMVRAVQEAVERILSGQDIRYYSSTPPSPAPIEQRPGAALPPETTR